MSYYVQKWPLPDYSDLQRQGQITHMLLLSQTPSHSKSPRHLTLQKYTWPIRENLLIVSSKFIWSAKFHIQKILNWQWHTTPCQSKLKCRAKQSPPLLCCWTLERTYLLKPDRSVLFRCWNDDVTHSQSNADQTDLWLFGKDFQFSDWVWKISRVKWMARTCRLLTLISTGIVRLQGFVGFGSALAGATKYMEEVPLCFPRNDDYR